MRHCRATNGLATVVFKGSNAPLIVLLMLLSACTLTPKPTKVLLDVPVPDVSWQTVAAHCAIPDLPAPIVLETLLTQLPKACEWLPSFDYANNVLQPLCQDADQCKRLNIIDARGLDIPVIAANSGYEALAEAQQRITEISADYGALTADAFGDIDYVAKRGLKAYDQTGLNPYAKPLLAGAASELISGVWASAEQWLGGLQQGQSYLSVSPNSSVRLQASFSNDECATNFLQATALIDVAPQGVKQLHFKTEVQHDLSEGRAYIVKHWLDLSGRLKRRTLPVELSLGCKVVTDTEFDEAYASAYFLVIKNTAATSPIWYLPPRG